MPFRRFESNTLRQWLCLGAATLSLAGCGGSGGTSASTEPEAPAAALPESAGVFFSARSVEVSESTRHVAIGITRTGEGVGATAVGFSLNEVSASLPHDLDSADGRLDWADGEVGERTVHLLVHSDDEFESSETIELVLEPIVGDRPLSGPLTITILDAPCDGVLPGRIDSDVRLDAPCYRLDEDLAVGSSAQLAIAAGTTVIAAAGTSIAVENRAALVVEGVARQPVSLVGANRVPGYWKGVRIASSSPLQQFTSTLLADAVIGVEALPGTTLVRFDGGSVDNTSLAAFRLPLDQAEFLDGSVRISRSDGGVELTGTTLRREESARLPAIGTHYTLSNDLLVAGALTIDAGVELRFARNRRAFIAGSGSIRAIGTADAPVMFGAIDAVAGAWGGLQLNDATGDNRLEHVTIRHGGADAARDGNLSISGNGTRLHATRIMFEGSAGVGLWLDGGLPGVTFDALLFENNRLGQVRRGPRIEAFSTL